MIYLLNNNLTNNDNSSNFMVYYILNIRGDFMNFLIDFCGLFIENHGQKVFDSICNIIRTEYLTEYDEEYLQTIFKIALLDFWGMSDDKITKFLKDINNIDNVNITNIKKIHKNSIKKIQQYLNSATKSEK